MGNFRRRLMMQQGGRGKYLTNRDPSVVTTLDIFSLLKPISQTDIVEVETEWISEEYYPLFTTRGLNIINIRGLSNRYFRVIGYKSSSYTVPSLGYIRFGADGYIYPVRNERRYNFGANAYTKIVGSKFSPSQIYVYYYDARGELKYYMADMSKLGSNYYGNYGTTIYSGEVNFYGDMKIGHLTLGSSVLVPTKKNGVCGYLEENSGLFIGNENLILTD